MRPGETDSDINPLWICRACWEAVGEAQGWQPSVEGDALEQTVASALAGVEQKRGLAAYVAELRERAACCLGEIVQQDVEILHIIDEIEERFLAQTARRER